MGCQGETKVKEVVSCTKQQGSWYHGSLPSVTALAGWDNSKMGAQLWGGHGSAGPAQGRGGRGVVVKCWQSDGFLGMHCACWLATMAAEPGRQAAGEWGRAGQATARINGASAARKGIARGPGNPGSGPWEPPTHGKQRPSLRGAELKEGGDGVGVLGRGGLWPRQQRHGSPRRAWRAGSCSSGGSLRHQRLFEQRNAV